MTEIISGIYLIRCVPTGKVYVGSSGNITTRWNIHRNDLIRGCHANSYLQATWNKYGADAFAWDVIELVEEDRLIEREQHFIDSLRACDRNRGFNLRVFARSNRGMKMSEETRAKISAARKGKPLSEESRQSQRTKIAAFWANRTSEERAAIAKATSDKNRGKTRSAEQRARMSALAKADINRTERIRELAIAMRGKSITEEHRAKIAAGKKGCTRSPEHRAKLAAANLGKNLSPEHRAKMIEGQRNISPEARARRYEGSQRSGQAQRIKWLKLREMIAAILKSFPLCDCTPEPKRRGRPRKSN